MCIGETTAGAAAPGALAKLFGFTRQESRVASMLSEGQELAGAAAKLNITYETARKHLQSILRKSGSHRQSELVRLILGGVAKISSR
jgi:DNA-binding CsgD family transcriptional regulator